MGKFRYLLVLLISLMVVSINVSAATCEYEERATLNSEVANVKANYEVLQRVLDPSEYTVPDYVFSEGLEDEYEETEDYFQINILNLTENLYVEVTNNYDDTETIYNYSDSTDGNITFTWTDIYTQVTFTLKFYSSSETGCQDTLLRTLYVSLPRYNTYSELSICTQIPDYYLCQQYVTWDEVSYESFLTSVDNEIAKQTQEEEEEENEAWYEKVGDFIVEHKIAFIAGGIVLVVVAGTVTFIIIRKRRREII